MEFDCVLCGSPANECVTQISDSEPVPLCDYCESSLFDWMWKELGEVGRRDIIQRMKSAWQAWKGS